MTQVVELAPKRTGLDIILGLILLVGGFVVLGNAVVATAVSIFFLAWTTLIIGVILLVGSLLRIRKGGFWSAALGGAILVVIGLFFLRNPLLGAAALTVLAGAMFLTSGLVRIVVGFGQTELRFVLILSGALSMALGLWVLFNPVDATLQLLGILLGVQILVEGMTLLAFGRLRPTKTPVAASA